MLLTYFALVLFSLMSTGEHQARLQMLLHLNTSCVKLTVKCQAHITLYVLQRRVNVPGHKVAVKIK